MSLSGTICPEGTLTGPNNYEIWKVCISAKLRAEKVFGVTIGTNQKPILSSSSVTTTSDVHEWQECDEKAHGIIQLHISDALLMKTHSYSSAKELFDVLVKLHETPNISSAFYLFKQLFSSTWDGTSAVSKYISSLQTVEARLAGMKISVESKILSFILLNSLPNTPEWEMFTSSVVNTVEDSKLTFNAIETQVTAEDAQLYSSGHSGTSGRSSYSESAMKASGNSRPAHASSWCEHHLSATHNSSEQIWLVNMYPGL